MRVEFTERTDGPSNLLCEAAVHFEEGELKGMKLVGFSLWKGKDGDTYVTFPCRSYGQGTEKKFYDFLRSSEGGAAFPKAVKSWILAEHKAQMY